MRICVVGFILCLSLFSSKAFAQGSPFETSEKSPFQSFNFSLGYGVVSYQGMFAEALNQTLNFDTRQTGPIHFRFGYRMSKVVEIGTSLNYEDQEFSWVNSNQNPGRARIKSFSGLFRANFHFLKSQSMDCYFGVGLGLRYDQYDLSVPVGSADFEFPFGVSQILPGAELVFGYRGFITDYIGLYTELGFTKSPLQLGVCVKLK